MATANGSGIPAPAEDDSPDRTRRFLTMQAVVDKWSPITVLNRRARRMNEQHQAGEPTTGRRSCWSVLLPPAAAVAVLIIWAVR